MRDEIGTFYKDQDFEALFPKHGQPAFSPWRLAQVCVMQFMEELSDRQTADAVRSRIDWKYALGLELTDPSFNFSILWEFRARVITGGASQQLLDRIPIYFPTDYSLLSRLVKSDRLRRAMPTPFISKIPYHTSCSWTVFVAIAPLVALYSLGETLLLTERLLHVRTGTHALLAAHEAGSYLESSGVEWRAIALLECVSKRKTAMLKV